MDRPPSPPPPDKPREPGIGPSEDLEPHDQEAEFEAFLADKHAELDARTPRAEQPAPPTEGIEPEQAPASHTADGSVAGAASLTDSPVSELEGEGDSASSSYAVELDETGWPIASESNCEECAGAIREQIGGSRGRVDPPPGAPRLGPSAKDPAGEWRYHEFVVKDGRAYDAFTGREGMLIDDFVDQFDYKDGLHFDFPNHAS